jgi:hypothetical protein
MLGAFARGNRRTSPLSVVRISVDQFKGSGTGHADVSMQKREENKKKKKEGGGCTYASELRHVTCAHYEAHDPELVSELVSGCLARNPRLIVTEAQQGDP